QGASEPGCTHTRRKRVLRTIRLVNSCSRRSPVTEPLEVDVISCDATAVCDSVFSAIEDWSGICPERFHCLRGKIYARSLRTRIMHENYEACARNESPAATIKPQC